MSGGIPSVYPCQSLGVWVSILFGVGCPCCFLRDVEVKVTIKFKT